MFNLVNLLVAFEIPKEMLKDLDILQTWTQFLEKTFYSKGNAYLLLSSSLKYTKSKTLHIFCIVKKSLYF